MKRVLVYGMTHNPGGIESYLMSWFRRTQGKTLCIDFLCDFPTMAYADEVEKAGSVIHFIPAKSEGLLAHWKATFRVLRTHPEYRTVYFNVLDAGAVFTVVIARLLRRRVVVHSHNGATDKPRLHRLCKPFLRLLVRRRAACSTVAALHLFGRTNGVLIVPNVIDADAFAVSPALRDETRAKLGLANGQLAVCHIGRLSWQKNPEGVLDCFEEIKKRVPDARLISVGDGELSEEFHADIARRGLGDAVMPLGKRRDIPALMQAADVLILPSRYEGLPIVALEAQAAGLPCVLSKAVPPETVCTENTVRLPAEDTAGFAEAAVRLARMKRKNTKEDIVRAGYDVSCAERYDRQLDRMFK